MTTDPRSVGVEEELLLVDPATGAPVAVAETVLSRAGQGDHDAAVEAELQQEQIETETAPTVDLAELEQQLKQRRREAADLAAAAGARLAALGTSPVPAEPTTTAKRRYLRMAAQLGLTATELLTCGCHVHVDVDSEAEGVGVLDRIRLWLPVLLALTANSPFWQGRDSGYASYRSRVWARLPTAGPTDVFGSPTVYAERVAALLATGVMGDRGMLYDDARLSHRYPTVEIRVADICLRAPDATVVAGLARALVTTAAEAWRDGERAPEVPTGILRLASWRAARSGLEGDLLHPSTGRPVPAPQVVEELLRFTAAALERSGDLDRVGDGVEHILRRGSGVIDQRRAGSPAAVVRMACELTLA